jgi:hypothetical protein
MPPWRKALDSKSTQEYGTYDMYKTTDGQQAGHVAISEARPGFAERGNRAA